MKSFKLMLAAATAIGVVLGVSAASADDSNSLYIKQTGSDNKTDVHQSGGSGNAIGSSSSSATQDGDRNYLRYTNGGYAGGSDNDILKLRQHGNDNLTDVRDSNAAAHTRINNILQDGNVNQLGILRQGEQGSTIGQVTMDGDRNTVLIKQLGAGGGINNTISLVKVVGNKNGVPGAATPAAGAFYGPGISIVQTSTTAGSGRNTITEASIEGSNNSGNAFSWATVMSITQKGSDNGQIASIARMKGSNGNGLRVSEIGDFNNFDVRQGLNSASTGNYADVSQNGNGNTATATQYGDGNGLKVSQSGNDNTSTTLFTGDNNGVGSMTGIAGSLVSDSGGLLVQGTVSQDSQLASGNSVFYTVNGSNNLFAFTQKGGSNSITGTVGSDSNQVAVLQVGNTNTTTFTQTAGAGNVIAVSQ